MNGLDHVHPVSFDFALLTLTALTTIEEFPLNKQKTRAIRDYERIYRTIYKKSDQKQSRQIAGKEPR